MLDFDNCGCVIYENDEVEISVLKYEGVPSIAIFAPEGCYTFNYFEDHIPLLKEYFVEFDIIEEVQNKIIEKAYAFIKSPATYLNS